MVCGYEGVERTDEENGSDVRLRGSGTDRTEDGTKYELVFKGRGS